jgi:DNA-binding MarR family transcriptional regulator
VSGDRVLLGDAAVTVFRLNGQFLALAEELARPAGLTAARWQVLGAIVQQPLSVADIARAMGITRQSVQRIADLVVEQGLAEYVPNPAHRRAKLVQLTAEGNAALDRIRPLQKAAARRLVAAMGSEELAETVDRLTKLSAAMDQLAR